MSNQYLECGFWLSSAAVQRCWAVSYIVEIIVIQLAHLYQCNSWDRGSSKIFTLSKNEESRVRKCFCAGVLLLPGDGSNLFYPKQITENSSKWYFYGCIYSYCSSETHLSKKLIIIALILHWNLKIDTEMNKFILIWDVICSKPHTN